MATPSQGSEPDTPTEITEAVGRGQWIEVLRLVHTEDCSPQQRHWAIDELVKNAPEWILCDRLDEICDSYADNDSLVSHLLIRRMWRCVGRVIQRDISHTQHRQAVEKASRLVDDLDFCINILPYCYNDELDSVLNHLVSRGLWRSVGKVLERGVSSSQHRWAVEQASRHADEWNFVNFVLPHCADEELEQVFSHMVSWGVWEPVDNVTDMARYILSRLMALDVWPDVGSFLQQNISGDVHRWAVEEASKQCDDDRFVKYILPQCHDEELDSVLTHLVSRGLWRSVGEVLGRGVDPSLHRSVLVQAVGHVGDSLYHSELLRHCTEYNDVVAVFPLLVANEKWTCVRHVLLIMARDTLRTWITSEHGSGSRDTLFWEVIHSCDVNGSLAFGLTKAATQQMKDCVLNECWGRCHIDSSDLAGEVSWRRSLCELFITTMLYAMCDLMCSDDRQYTDSTENTDQRVYEIYTHTTVCIKDNILCIKDGARKTIQNKQKWTSVFTELADTNSNGPLFLLHFLQGLNLYHTSRRGNNDDEMLLVIMAVFPLFPQLQSVALRIMLREKRWDVLSQACLSHVWEHDHWRLFKAAVMQRQWDVVRQWCDHTVHDDQRHWALTEAFKEKQWEVYLLLADHGLTVDEQMYAHYRVAKYGHWATVLNMVDRGGDITEVSNLLEKWVMRYLRKKPEGDATVYEQRCMKLIRLRLRFARKSVFSPRKALERCLWGTVLFNILHKPTKRFFSEVLDKVLEEQHWHVLMHLVRLGISSADRDRLFPDMVRQQQWGVCRQLLEHGVDDQLCLETLPELMVKNQWMLVARVMEHDVDDAVRRQVLLWAFQRRAGALFWHCLNTMEEQEDLSTAVKEQLFHQAISREIWQVVKPLVKEKDGPDIQRRDLAFLEAIGQHLWDVVDYCQRLGADINMKDENGETPLNREARKREWKAVEEIVLRDGDPNHLDKDGVSVMNRLIDHKQWDIVKVVIKYGGDIHLSARCSTHRSHLCEKQSPLQALITARQADVIHSTIKWCGGQDWGVNDKGERVLHAVCDSDRWDVMRDLMDIKVNPLVLTNTGKSPLAYAVLNTKCGQRMVAECSRQGFSFHQPSLTGPQETLLQDVSQAVVEFSTCRYKSLFNYIRMKSNITSPLVCAVLCELPVVAFMLYESGSCSNAELFTLHTQLPNLTDLNTEEGGRLDEEVDREVERWPALAGYILPRYTKMTHTLKWSTAFIRELATTPRPLLSSCRLKILQSPCFHFSHKHREKAMEQLRLPIYHDLSKSVKSSDLGDPEFKAEDYRPLPLTMKKYLQFSDLCDPEYKAEYYRPLPLTMKIYRQFYELCDHLF